MLSSVSCPPLLFPTINRSDRRTVCRKKRHFFVPLLFCLCFNLVFATRSVAQEVTPKITVTGVVTDTAGVVIQGASVAVLGGKNVGTTTDVNGRFILDIPAGSQLQISYVGHIPELVTPTSTNRDFQVTLKQIQSTGDEVVVIAMGQKQRKEAIVGSVTSIKTGDLKIPASNHWDSSLWIQATSVAGGSNARDTFRKNFPGGFFM